MIIEYLKESSFVHLGFIVFICNYLLRWFKFFLNFCLLACNFFILYLINKDKIIIIIVDVRWYLYY